MDLMDYMFGYISMGTMLFMFILIIVAIVSYFLSSIALMKMAQTEGVSESWLAWIPVGNLYIVGKLIKSLEFQGKTYNQAELILPSAVMASVVLGNIPLIGSIANILMGILTLSGFFMLYKRYAPEKAKKYMVISVLLPLLGSSLVLFRIKDLRPAARDVY